MILRIAATIGTRHVPLGLSSGLLIACLATCLAVAQVLALEPTSRDGQSVPTSAQRPAKEQRPANQTRPTNQKRPATEKDSPAKTKPLPPTRPTFLMPSRQSKERAGPVPSAEQIAEWVKQLDDNRFSTRTLATDRLIQTGAPAVGPVSDAVDSESLEVSLRAIHVLRQMALSLDVPTEERSLVALQTLAASEQRLTARRARKAIEALGEVRQQRTLAELRRLGAVVQGNEPSGFAPFQRLEVEIGDAWKGSLQDVRRLIWLQDLKKITLAGPQVTDAWVAILGNLNNLSYVAIRNAQITDESLRVISKLKTVVYVDVMYTPVSDIGFEQLRTMKSLRSVRCFGTRVTRPTVERFQADFASVEVQFKLGAFLGVRCQQPPWPCEVQLVTEKSAAELAGVKPGDIISEFDGQAVSSFDDLQRLIALKKVGDSVEIRVAREGKLKTEALYRRDGQVLGFEGEPTAIGVKVKSIAAGGAMEKAGVKKGDLLMALEDDRIVSVEQFEKRYKDDKSTRIWRLHYLRDVNFARMKVTFGEWNE